MGNLNRPDPCVGPPNINRIFGYGRPLNIPEPENECNEYALYLIVQYGGPPTVPWNYEDDTAPPFNGGAMALVRLRNGRWEFVRELPEFPQYEHQVPVEWSWGHYFGNLPNESKETHWLSVGWGSRTSVSVAFGPGRELIYRGVHKTDDLFSLENVLLNVDQQIDAISDTVHGDEFQPNEVAQMAQAADGTMFAIDWWGSVWRSNNEFDSWEWVAAIYDFDLTISEDDFALFPLGCLATHPTNPNIVAYMFFHANYDLRGVQDFALLVTTDGGNTWAKHTPAWPFPHYDGDPGDPAYEADAWDQHSFGLTIAPDGSAFFVGEVIPHGISNGVGFGGNDDPKYLVLFCSEDLLNDNAWKGEIIHTSGTGFTIYGPIMTAGGNGKYFAYGHENFGAQFVGFNSPLAIGTATIMMSSTPGNLSSWSQLPDPGFDRSIAMCYDHIDDILYICNREPSTGTVIKMMRNPPSSWEDATLNLHSLFGGDVLNVIVQGAAYFGGVP